MSILEWPDVLRAAGIDVYERPGWKNNKPLGGLSSTTKIYWHHDASPVGNSPGAWDWICSSYDSKEPSAQMWLSYTGQWRFVGSGIAYHAGTTANPNDWHQTVGLETDHTIRECYSDHMLNVIQRGFAAICKHEGRNSDFITFHKWEARPMGRKTDPYLRTDGGSQDDQSCWASELSEQRRIIQGYIDDNTSTNTSQGDNELSAAEVQLILSKIDAYNTASNNRFNEVLTDVVNRLYAIQTQVSTLEGLLFEPGQKGPGHEMRREIQFATTEQIIPAIEANK